MKKELVIAAALPLNESQRARLQAAAPQAELRILPPAAATAEDVRDADILMGKIPPEVCRYALKARWYQSHAAGPDAYLKPGVFAPEVLITSARGAYGLAVGEHLFAMTWALLKRLPGYRDAQHDHVWKSQGQVASLFNANVLVVGMGDLGSYYAKLCAGAGAQVTGLRRHVGKKPEYLKALCSVSCLDELLPRADVVALCLPGGKSTRGMMDEARIARMKPGAILVNAGRGTTVDTMALLKALRAGALRGVGLDVTDPEPLPPDHPLWDEPNALITPHVAGYFHLPETVERIVNIAEENLRRYLAGQPLENLVERSPAPNETKKGK